MSIRKIKKIKRIIKRGIEQENKKRKEAKEKNK